MTKTKQDRLREVYEHVRANYGIHTQGDFADALGITRPACSAAMNGKESYLTENLFKRICAAYQGVFNLDYLLTGRGELLMERPHSPQPAENNKSTADMVELYAQRIRLVDDLRASLREELNEVKAMRQELQQATTNFNEASTTFIEATKRLNRAIRELNKNSGRMAADN